MNLPVRAGNTRLRRGKALTAALQPKKARVAYNGAPMVTAKHIAARLNMAISTVGRALADDPRISQRTKQRVRTAASEMGYIANRAARVMRGGSSNLVALAVPDIRNSFYSTIAHALSMCLQSAGLQLMLAETDDDPLAERGQLRELVGANVAGVILVPTAKPTTETIKLLQRVPHVQLLRRHESLGRHWFGMDDTDALEQAARHLFDLGHRRIAYVGGTKDVTTGALRLRGVQRAAEAGRQRDPPVLEVLGPPSSSEFGRETVARLLAQSTAPTALMAGSVQITHGMLEELHRRRINVPRQLSVIGFGDEPGFSWWGPGLTTVAPPVFELATSCGLWFVHQLKSKVFADAPNSVVTPAVLVVRGSTAAPPTDAGNVGRRPRRSAKFPT